MDATIYQFQPREWSKKPALYKNATNKDNVLHLHTVNKLNRTEDVLKLFDAQMEMSSMAHGTAREKAYSEWFIMFRHHERNFNFITKRHKKTEAN